MLHNGIYNSSVYFGRHCLKLRFSNESSNKFNFRRTVIREFSQGEPSALHMTIELTTKFFQTNLTLLYSLKKWRKFTEI